MQTNSKLLITDPIRYYVQIQRGIAFIVDITIVSIPFLILKNGINYEGFIYFLFPVLALSYFVYFEYKNGQTLGKKLLGIKVLMMDGTGLTFATSIKRNLLKSLELVIPIVGWLAFILVYTTPKKQSFWDLLVGTVVVRTY